MAKGLIQRVEDDTAWGTFDNGTTFDIPSFGYKVGDDVEMILRPADIIDEDDLSDLAFILCDQVTATIVTARFTDEGIEVLGYETLSKPAN